MYTEMIGKTHNELIIFKIVLFIENFYHFYYSGTEGAYLHVLIHTKFET